jgi:hypothetical protein
MTGDPFLPSDIVTGRFTPAGSKRPVTWYAKVEKRGKVFTLERFTRDGEKYTTETATRTRTHLALVTLREVTIIPQRMNLKYARLENADGT